MVFLDNLVNLIFRQAGREFGNLRLVVQLDKPARYLIGGSKPDSRRYQRRQICKVIITILYSLPILLLDLEELFAAEQAHTLSRPFAHCQYYFMSRQSHLFGSGVAPSLSRSSSLACKFAEARYHRIALLI